MDEFGGGSFQPLRHAHDEGHVGLVSGPQVRQSRGRATDCPGQVDPRKTTALTLRFELVGDERQLMAEGAYAPRFRPASAAITMPARAAPTTTTHTGAWAWPTT